MEGGEKDLGITAKKAENFSEWYQQVLVKTGFIDYTEVSGCLAYRPASYGAWEMLSRAVDKEFKKDGIENVYFPLFIPEKFLQKEKEHVEGFSPEVAWVTETGNTKLDERLAVRPTSETIMYPSYSKWVRSWRDLPMRYNQWNNVVRWEFKHPAPFIRSREFLWNEGHTVFAKEEEALAERKAVLKIYEKMLKEYLALPGIPGKKTDSEKFAGAVASFSIEHIMPDGWAIQGPDFHSYGQNFSKAFDIKFLDESGKEEYAWQNTFAITTRELGVMVATHGDDRGLVLPPKVAYMQIVIVPIYKKEKKEEVLAYAKKVANSLKKFRVRLDSREGYSPGFKFSDWEMKGIPLRIEVGEREAASGKATLVRRDTGEKTEVDSKELGKKAKTLLEEIHESLYKKAFDFLMGSVHEVNDYAEFKATLEEKKGMIHASWCGSSECEAKIKEETGAKITNMPFKHCKQHEKCVYCGKKGRRMANFARSY